MREVEPAQKGRGEGRRGGGPQRQGRQRWRECERETALGRKGETCYTYRDGLVREQWGAQAEDTEYGDRKQHTDAAREREDTGAETLAGSEEAMRPAARRMESTLTDRSVRKDP